MNLASGFRTNSWLSVLCCMPSVAAECASEAATSRIASNCDQRAARLADIEGVALNMNLTAAPRVLGCIHSDGNHARGCCGCMVAAAIVAYGLEPTWSRLFLQVLLCSACYVITLTELVRLFGVYKTTMRQE